MSTIIVINENFFTTAESETDPTAEAWSHIEKRGVFEGYYATSLADYKLNAVNLRYVSFNPSAVRTVEAIAR